MDNDLQNLQQYFSSAWNYIGYWLVSALVLILIIYVVWKTYLHKYDGYPPYYREYRGWQNFPEKIFEIEVLSKRTNGLRRVDNRKNYVRCVDGTGRTGDMQATTEVYPEIKVGRARIIAKGPVIIGFQRIR